MNENHKDEWENYTQEDHDDYMKALDRLGVDKTLKRIEKGREERESKEQKEKYPNLLKRIDKLEHGLKRFIDLQHERIKELEEKVEILRIDNLI